MFHILSRRTAEAHPLSLDDYYQYSLTEVVLRCSWTFYLQ